jgi:hypothetical protein
VLCEGASGVCNKNVTDSWANWDTSFVYDSLESYLLALESIGVYSGKYAVTLFLLVESSIPENALIVWWRNTGALLRNDNGRSIIGDRIKDLSFLHSEFGGDENSSLVKFCCRLSVVVAQKENCNKQVEEMPTTATDLLSGKKEKKKNCIFVLGKI